MSTYPQSWSDLPLLAPADPRSLIAEAKLNSVQGTFTRSTDFLNPTWVALAPFHNERNLQRPSHR